MGKKVSGKATGGTTGGGKGAGKKAGAKKAGAGRAGAKRAASKKAGAGRAGAKGVERVLTLHPEGKQGVNVERAKYEEMRRALLRVIPRGAEGVAFGELAGLVEPLLDAGVFGGGEGAGVTRVMWWVTTVKQDLEARGEIVRVEGRGRQRVRRV